MFKFDFCVSNIQEQVFHLEVEMFESCVRVLEFHGWLWLLTVASLLTGPGGCGSSNWALVTHVEHLGGVPGAQIWAKLL